ncbi:MAG: tyrosine-protein phosphatase [Rhodoglobus sp.]
MRNLVWDGYQNARDLGGLPTSLSATGATIFGRVARGPRRELLPEKGWQDAHRWGLSTVVDLRCTHEIGARERDPDVSTEVIATLSVVNAPTEDQDNPEFREVCFPILDSPEYWRHNWRILPELVLGSLTAIANASAGVLVHCSAGRDRTGMISALLLSNAGVAPKDVAADYAESVRAMAGARTHAPNDRQAGWGIDEVENWISATAPTVEDVAADPDAAYAAIGASPELRLRLRAILIDD